MNGVYALFFAEREGFGAFASGLEPRLAYALFCSLVQYVERDGRGDNKDDDVDRSRVVFQCFVCGDAVNVWCVGIDGDGEVACLFEGVENLVAVFFFVRRRSYYCIDVLFVEEMFEVLVRMHVK